MGAPGGRGSFAYALAGLDPATGFTTSVAYGLLALVSTLPGLVPLVWELGRRTPDRPDRQPGEGLPAHPDDDPRS